jgi:hypothetical protein
VEKSESESEPIIGGSEVESHRKSRTMASEQKDPRRRAATPRSKYHYRLAGATTAPWRCPALALEGMTSEMGTTGFIKV